LFPKTKPSFPLALMGAVSPDLEKQGFFAVVFVNREYSGQQESMPADKALSFAPYHCHI